MIKNIAFDLDGVLRDLWGWFEMNEGIPRPDTWDYRWKGMSIWHLVKKYQYKALETAPATPYLQWIRNFFPLGRAILTSQPLLWRPHTTKWVNYWIPESTMFFLSPRLKEKVCKIYNWWLVEDSPRLSSYEKVILIDYPYNKEVKAPYRAHNVEELETIVFSLIEKGELKEG